MCMLCGPTCMNEPVQFAMQPTQTNGYKCLISACPTVPANQTDSATCTCSHRDVTICSEIEAYIHIGLVALQHVTGFVLHKPSDMTIVAVDIEVWYGQPEGVWNMTDVIVKVRPHSASVAGSQPHREGPCPRLFPVLYQKKKTFVVWAVDMEEARATK